MKLCIFKATVLMAVVGLISCSTGGAGRKLTFYHGQNVPPEYIRVVQYTAEEIEFRIRVEFAVSHLYHLVLEGDEPLAEGWFPTAKGTTEGYTVKMKAKKGVSFVPGKKYRLCIGQQNPEEVILFSSTYRCITEYEFTLKEN